MLRKIEKTINIIIVFLFILFVISCANIVSPSGGPRDNIPPMVKSSEPANYAVNFKDKKIKITFNEYVSLKDQAGQVVVSPPTDEEFEFGIKGKSIIINLPDSLKDSTVYTIYFGESVCDITEDNPISNYEFSFSRGGIMDSLQMQGIVMDALSLEPVKGVYIMLYDNDEDSTPVKQKPLYITKTNAKGKFILKHIKPGRFKIFALSDMNSDLLFNQPNESIAFSDSLRTPQYINKKSDSLAKADSTYVPEVVRNIELKMFLQPDSVQKLLKARSEVYRQIKLIFKNPVKELKINVLNKILPENWKTDEFSLSKDTLTCWLMDPDADSLKLEIVDDEYIVDTVTIALRQKPTDDKKPHKPGGKNVEEISKLALSSSASSGSLPYYKPLLLKCANPLASFDSSKIILSEKKDSLLIPVTFRASLDENPVKRTCVINYDWQPKTTYNLLVLPGAFTDIYKLTNDSLKVTFTTNSPEDYGKLFFTLKHESIEKKYLIQLLTESNTLISQKNAGNNQIVFENLIPANYKIRIVEDVNKNDKWDTGDYFKRKQPEPVFYFPQQINIRANWDTEFDFVLQ